MSKKILTIDGGGIKGIIPAVICAEIEKHTGKKINEIFDLISGSSTGSILGSGLSLGIPAQKMLNMYVNYGKPIFTKRTKWFRPWEYLTKPKYEKKYIRKYLSIAYGKETTITDINDTKFMSATHDIVNNKYEFFTSWQSKYNNDKLVDVVIYSMSAPYLFGRTKDDIRHTFFSDGAVGLFNSTPLTASVEASKLGWFDNEQQVDILSLGCGVNSDKYKYDDVSDWNNIDEILDVFIPKEIHNINGLKNSIINYLILDKIKIYERINPMLSHGLSSLDGVNNIDELIKIGNKAAENVVNLSILK